MLGKISLNVTRNQNPNPVFKMYLKSKSNVRDSVLPVVCQWIQTRHCTRMTYFNKSRTKVASQIYQLISTTSFDQACGTETDVRPRQKNVSKYYSKTKSFFGVSSVLSVRYVRSVLRADALVSAETAVLCDSNVFGGTLNLTQSVSLCDSSSNQ